jgi:hypothetical protein
MYKTTGDKRPRGLRTYTFGSGIMLSAWKPGFNAAVTMRRDLGGAAVCIAHAGRTRLWSAHRDPA